MNKWPGKYVIGLTGNIATGKSVVRRMLEYLGAYTIDADVLSHRAMSKEGPAHSSVVDYFGKFILNNRGEIDRTRLGRIVFSDPQALKILEELIHPHIQQAVEILIRRSSQKVVVIEAIKLLEGQLFHDCDSIWVVTAPESIQRQRLMTKRGMNESEALQRIHVQSPQANKKAVADIIIDNTGSFDDTWQQVITAWEKCTPPLKKQGVQIKGVDAGKLTVHRGLPRDSSRIANFINSSRNDGITLSETDIMEYFGEMAFLLLTQDGELVGLAGWQVENLVARTIHLYLDTRIDQKPALSFLLNKLEKASSDLQCEASLIFLPTGETRLQELCVDSGYKSKTIYGLMVEAWKEAAIESKPAGTVMLFKQLRADRILRPI